MEYLLYISCVRFSLQLLIGEAVFVLHWKRKTNFSWRLAASLTGYFVMSYVVYRTFTRIPGENPVAYMAYYTVLFLLTLIMMSQLFFVNRTEILFAGVCGYATQHIAFALTTIVRELTKFYPGGWIDFILFRFFPYVLVSILIYMFLVKKYEGISEVKERDIRMVILSLVILTIVIFASVLADSGSSTFQNTGFLKNILCKVYGLLGCMMSIFVAFYLSRQNRILREQEVMEHMLEGLRGQQELSRENINIINIKCHDLKYRISKISRIEDERNQEEYIEEIRNAISIYDNIFQTGNDALDLVLTEKSLMCNEYHVKLSSMVEGSILEFMNSTDTYALFANLLDNALESVLKEPDEEKRIISILVTKRMQGCHIHIENYCNEAVRFEDGLPLTTKQDKNYHGFGVRSIRYIVEKYHGDVLMQQMERKFFVNILFYN